MEISVEVFYLVMSKADSQSMLGTVLQGDELEYLGDFAIRLITVFTIRHSIRF